MMKLTKILSKKENLQVLLQSSNIEEMEKGAQKNIDDMKNLGYINV